MAAAIDTLQDALRYAVSQCEILGRQLVVTEASVASLRASLDTNTAAAADIRAAISKLAPNG